jgi:hypothetical protein
VTVEVDEHVRPHGVDGGGRLRMRNESSARGTLRAARAREETSPTTPARNGSGGAVHGHGRDRGCERRWFAAGHARVRAARRALAYRS